MADDLDAGLGEPQREQLALVAQRVVLGGGDERRRQGVQPVGDQRGEVGVVQVGRVAAYCRQYHSASRGSKPSAAVR